MGQLGEPIGRASGKALLLAANSRENRIKFFNFFLKKGALQKRESYSLLEPQNLRHNFSPASGAINPLLYLMQLWQPRHGAALLVQPQEAASGPHEKSLRLGEEETKRHSYTSQSRPLGLGPARFLWRARDGAASARELRAAAARRQRAQQRLCAALRGPSRFIGCFWGSSLRETSARICDSLALEWPVFCGRALALASHWLGGSSFNRAKDCLGFNGPKKSGED